MAELVEVAVPIYDEVRNFSEGFAYFMLNGKGGLIDTSGSEALQGYDIVSYSHGLAWIRRDGKIGVVDTLGNEIVPPVYEYDSIVAYSENAACYQKDGKWGILSLAYGE